MDVIPTAAEIGVSQPQFQEVLCKLQGTSRSANSPSPRLLYYFPHFYNYLLGWQKCPYPWERGYHFLAAVCTDWHRRAFTASLVATL